MWKVLCGECFHVAFDISYTLVRVGTVGTNCQIHIHIILHPTCTTLTQVVKHVVCRPVRRGGSLGSYEPPPPPPVPVANKNKNLTIL